MISEQNIGASMYDFAKSLYKIPRSLTGNGNRETLARINEMLDNKLVCKEVATGTKCFDWEIPKEWNVKSAYIITPKGEKICDFSEHNLHLVGYSTPLNAELTWAELAPHLHTLKEQENAIPYITSYYKEYWGFCLTHTQKEQLQKEYQDSKEKFKVVIDSELKEGALSYGELFIEGKNKKEIVLSTYICHPQMANNELSGIVVGTFIAKYLLSKAQDFSYRILFIPETIGSIYYLSKHLKELKENCVAGLVLTCIGDDRAVSYLASRVGNNLADRAVLNVLKNRYPNFKQYSYLERGSDERQYCAVGVDLPFCTLMRSKFAEYPEYHTSLDDLSVISPKGLQGSYMLLKEILKTITLNAVYKNTILCEPQLGKRGLYPQLSTKDTINKIKDMRNLLMYCDGKADLLEIADICGFALVDMEEWLRKFLESGILEKVR